MSEITIPPAALEAGVRTLCHEQRLFWHGLTTAAQDIIRAEARAAFLAILEAWPEMRISWLASNDGAIVLPLPTEARAALEERT
tara:strand:- start:2377 stop:2628 length:252 start_codon:yes stop_codon:yes gene_type:complete